MTYPKSVRTSDRGLLDSYHGQRCSVCGKSPPSDPSHIRSRGSGGPDEKWNLMPMCRIHHTEWHKIGSITFMKKYPGFAWSLMAKGWRVEQGKLWHPNLARHGVTR